jgi:glycosyltransferase involved in cell wall biosynthesis
VELVSICIPVFNGSAFLGRALSSALAQTHTNLEIIVSDDGSTDDSGAIARKFAEENPSIRLLRNPDPGMVRNWKFAVESSTGAFFTMLMQDDFLEPCFVETLLNHIKKHRLTACTSLAFVRDAQLRLREIYFPGEFLRKCPTTSEGADGLMLFDGGEFLNGFAKDYRNGFVKYHTSFTIIDRAHYDQSGGFNPNLKYCADAALFLSLAQLKNGRFGFDSKSILSNLLGFGEHRVSSRAGVDVRFHDIFEILDGLQKSSAISVGDTRKIVAYETDHLNGWPLSDAAKIVYSRYSLFEANLFLIKFIAIKILRRTRGWINNP